MITSRIREGCSVGFFGLGKSNIALLGCLPLQKCKITIRSDSYIDPTRIPSCIPAPRLMYGKNACLEIDEDIIFFSPSVRRDRAELIRAKERGVIFSSDAEIFFEENKKPVYAVTGSDGKSTTATLIHLLLNAEGKKSRLIGNVGEAMTTHIGDADLFVTELSSFMLEYLSPRVYSACITNITPNHLDWHGSYENYKKTKFSVAKTAERVVVSDDIGDILCPYGIISDRLKYKELISSRRAKIYVTKEDGYILRNGEKLIGLSEIRCREDHNIKNLMMAIAMTDGEVERAAIMQVAASFDGLKHRSERFFSIDGVDYIDSSIDSTPARTNQTLKSIGRPVVIILGGRGKGLDYSELIPSLKKYVRAAIIVGENREELSGAIAGNVESHIASDFESGVRLGIALAKKVGILLLSPASTSYDQFENYAERGDKFKEIVLKYTTK